MSDIIVAHYRWVRPHNNNYVSAADAHQRAGRVDGKFSNSVLHLKPVCPHAVKKDLAHAWPNARSLRNVFGRAVRFFVFVAPFPAELQDRTGNGGSFEPVNRYSRTFRWKSRQDEGPEIDQMFASHMCLILLLLHTSLLAAAAPPRSGYLLYALHI